VTVAVRRTLIVPLRIGLVLLLTAFTVSVVLLVGRAVDRAGHAAAEGLSRNMGVTLTIGRIGWKPPFTIVLKGTEMTYAGDARLKAEELLLKFRLLGLLTRNGSTGSVVDHLREVSIRNTKIELDDRALEAIRTAWRSGSVRSNSRIHWPTIVFWDNEVLLKGPGFRVDASGVSGLLSPKSGGGWQGEFRADVVAAGLGHTMGFLWNGSVESFSNNPFPASSHEWKRVSMDGQPMEMIGFVINGRSERWMIRAASEDRKFQGTMTVSNSRIASARSVFRDFRIPSGAGVTLDGGVSWVSSLSIGLMAATPTSSCLVAITNGLVRKIEVRKSGKEIAVLRPFGRSGSALSGFFRWIPEKGEAVTAPVTLRQSPGSLDLTVAEFRSHDRVLLRPIRIQTRRNAGRYEIISQDSLVSGTVVLRSLSKSSLVLHPAVADPAFGRWRMVAGEIRADSSGLDFTGFVLRSASARSGVAVDARYDMRTNTIRMRILKEGTREGVRGRWVRSDGRTWLFLGDARARGRTFPITGSAIVRRNVVALKAESGLFGRITGEIDPQGPFRFKADLDGQFSATGPSWKGAGLFAGRFQDPDSWFGRLDSEILDLRSSGFIMPRSTWDVVWKKNRDIRFDCVIADRRRNTWDGSGRIVMSPWFNIEFRGLGDCEFRIGRPPSGLEVFLRSGRFDLAMLNGFYLKGDSDPFAGILSLSLDTRKKRQGIEMLLSGTNLRFRDSQLDAVRLNARARNGVTRFSDGLLRRGGTQWNLMDGIIRSSNSVTRFASTWQAAGDSIQGFLEVSGQDAPDSLQVKLDTRGFKIRRSVLDRWTQYAVWNKRAGLVRLLGKGDGLNASIRLASMNASRRTEFAGEWMAGGSRALSFSGALTTDGRLSMNLTDLDIPLDTLPLVAGGIIASADGRLSGAVQGTGPWKSPVWNGTLGVKAGHIRMTDLIGSVDIRGFDTSARISDNLVVFDPVITKVSGGSVQVDGRMELAGYGVKDFDFNLSVLSNDYVYIKRYNDLQGFAAGRCSFSLLEGRPYIQGRLFVRKADFTFPFQGIPSARRAARPGRGAVLDLQITARDQVQYFQPMNNIQLDIKPGGSVQLSGLFGKRRTGEEVVRGRVHSDRGQMDYLGTAFQVRNVDLVFAEEYSPSVPYVKLSADSKIPVENGSLMVYLEGQGLLNEDFELHVTSTPSLTPREIVRVLGYGKLYDRVVLSSGGENQTIDLTDPTDQEMNSLLLAGVLTYFQSASESVLIRPLERRLRQAFGLDKFEVRPVFDEEMLRKGFAPGSATPGSAASAGFVPFWNSLSSTRFTVGKYFTEYLFLEYMLSFEKPMTTESIGAEASPRFQDKHQFRLEVNVKALSLEWKYRPAFTGTGQTTDPDTQEWEVRWQRPF
jgi:hypothetical protein